MRLRGRFALWFSVAALVSIAAAAMVTRHFLADSFREDFKKRRQLAEVSIENQLEQLRGSVRDALGSLASMRDQLVGGLLINLEKYEGELPPIQLRELARSGDAKMRGLGLDVLVITDTSDRVLVAPHNASMLDEREPRYAERARAAAGRAVFVRDRVLAASDAAGADARARAIRELLVVEVSETVRERSHRVTVTGGRIIDGSAIALSQPGLETRIVDAAGQVLVPPAGDWSEVADSVTRVRLADPTGEAIAWVEIGLSDAELKRLLHRVTVYSVGIAGAALVACVFLGLLFGRRMTRDLDQLVIGVQAAARGDLDHEVPVRTGDEIGTVARAVNLMMIDLKESKEQLAMAERVAAWKEIAQRLAHEIKNPLTPIQMSVETLRKTWAKQHPSFNEIFEESTATILEEAGRLKRIVGEFSRFARMPKPEKRALDLGEEVAQAAALYRGSVDIELALGEVPLVEADRDALRQVLLNLLENARDAVTQGDRQGGKIRVETLATRGGKGVALIVDDDGPGIPAEVKERLFTPYFTTKHATGGSGLGLAIVHRIVMDHNGKILALDSPLGGARFVVELPTRGAGADDLSASLTGQLP
jgi:signal transduction histidine kinase